MLQNFLTTAFRNIWRNKIHTAVNVVGLSFGLSCSLVLLLLVFYTISYNAFEENYDRIYRVVSTTKGQGGQTDYQMGVPVPLAEAMRNDFPEFEKVIYTQSHYGEMLFRVDREGEDKYFELRDARLVYTEPEYFDVFTVDVVEGDIHSALQLTGGTVINQSMAELLFPEGNVLGKSFTFNKDQELVVRAVVKDQKPNSDIPFDFYVSTYTIKNEMEEGSWSSVSSDNQCYILMAKDDQPQNYSTRIERFIAKYFKDYEEDNRTMALQPMSDLHYSEHYSNYSYRTVNDRDIIIMITVAVFLLLSACVNFINLSTAVAVKRAREIGVRKVLGSSKHQLISQFLLETLLIVTFSLIVGIGLAEILLIYINPLLEVQLVIDYLNPQFLLPLVGGVLLITMLAGAYPAFVLANYKPVHVLKNQMNSGTSGSKIMRKGLVIFQFFVSQFLIICTLIHISQMQLINEKDLGFRTDALIDLRIPEQDGKKMETLKNQLLNVAGVDEVSLTFSSPTSGSVSATNVYFENNPEDVTTAVKYADEDYIDIYDIELLAGRSYRAADSINEVVVNETLLQEMGFMGTPQEALGKMIRIWGAEVPIVGVVKDFHSVSLRHKVTGIMMFSYPDAYRQATLSVNLANFQETNREIEQIWSSFYPEYSYEYNFFDQYLLEFYDDVRQVAKVLGFFTFIAILIGCLGLFGLASFMANQKVKEVGVRKVLGASVRNILFMYSWSIAKLIVIAFVIAVPLAYFGMNEWLSDFEYRIDLTPATFIMAFAITVLIALVTIGYRSYSSATANPVESLRSE